MIQRSKIDPFSAPCLSSGPIVTNTWSDAWHITVALPAQQRCAQTISANVLKFPNVTLPTGRFPYNLNSFGRRECYEKCCKMVLEFHLRNSLKFTGKNYSLNNGSPFILHPPGPFLPFYSHKLHENQDHRWNSPNNIQRSIVNMDTLRYFRFIFLHNSPKTNLSEI